MIAAAASCFAQEGASNIEFVQNKGQWDSRVNFKGEMNTGAFFLQKTGFTVLLNNPDDLIKMTMSHHIPLKSDPSNGGSGGKVAAAASVIHKQPVNGEGGGSGGGSNVQDNGDVLIHSHAYRVSFVGASEDVTIAPPLTVCP